MTSPHWIRTILPRPRRPVGRREAWPLILFAAVFAAAVVGAELRGVVRFTEPRAFLLAAFLPWLWWMHVAGGSGLSRARGAAALLVRFALAGILIALLAGPRTVRRSDELAVVFALDLSDSIGAKASDAAVAFMAKAASEKPEKDLAGLVVFGKDAAVELPPRATFPFEAVNARIERDGTNLEKALALAAAVLPEDRPGRIVLVSDGAPTEGSVAGILDELKSRDVAVDVLPVRYAYEHETWLERLELPRTVKAGETYEAAVLLSSLTAGKGKLVLEENGEKVAEAEVEFSAGKSRFALPLYLREPGYYEYEARIEVPKDRDGWRENNRAVNALYLKGEGRVLAVVDPDGDPRDAEALVRAMREARRAVETRPATEFPRDALSLLPYDAVVFVNVPADAFDAVQQKALRDAVHGLGTGFLMVGGKNGFGPGGWHRTPVEEALPVSMDVTQKKVLPKGALAIILHTCEFPEGNTWGKRIAKEAIRVLGAQDEIGILVYDYNGGERWLFPLTPAGEYEKLSTLINGAEIGDMPSFANTMKMGLDALKANDAAQKHMIIISDGDPSPPPPTLVNDFVAAKVSVSMVAVFPHGGNDISVMKAVAAATGGRYYFPQDPAQLPSIFIKEAKTLKRSMIQNQTFTPRIEFPSDILKGLGELPALKGYVLTTPKERSTVILRGPETEQVDPVLAVWRHGLGRSAAWTSDLAPNWAAAWVEWPQYRAFVRQLLTDVSRVDAASDLRVRASASGGTGIVEVEDHHATESFLEVQAQVSGPGGRSETVRLRQVGPRRYEASFPLWGKGRYQVAALGAGDGRSEQAVGGFAVPYSPEYLRFRADPIALREIAQRTGGRELTGDEGGKELFPADRKARESSRPADDWFLVLLVCLVPLDVAVRRVQLDWTTLRGLMGLDQKKTGTDATLGALLQRKKEIVHERGARGGRGGAENAEKAMRPSGGDFITPVAAPPPPVPKKEEPPPPATGGEGAPASTMDRLLARKKQWKDPKGGMT